MKFLYCHIRRGLMFKLSTEFDIDSICSDPWRLGIFYFRYNLIYVNTIVFYKYNVVFHV